MPSRLWPTRRRGTYEDAPARGPEERASRPYPGEVECWPRRGRLVYSLEQTELSGYPIFASCVLWGEAITGPARRVCPEARVRDRARPSLMRPRTLADHSSARGARSTRKRYLPPRRGRDFYKSTLKRAKADLKVKSSSGPALARMLLSSGSFREIPQLAPPQTHISAETHISRRDPLSEEWAPLRRVGLYGKPKSGETGKTSGLEEGGILSASPSLRRAAFGDGVGVELSATGRMRAKGPKVMLLARWLPGVKSEARRARGGAPAGNLVRGLARASRRPTSAG